jgi:hypothetical protein
MPVSPGLVGALSTGVTGALGTTVGTWAAKAGAGRTRSAAIAAVSLDFMLICFKVKAGHVRKRSRPLGSDSDRVGLFTQP